MSILFLSLVTPQVLYSQDRISWKPLTTAGYGGLGCAAGFLLADELDRQEDLAGGRTELGVFSVIGGCIIGGGIGLKLGRETDSRLAAGGILPTAMRRGVQLGTVLAGTAAGTLVALVPASARDDGKTEVVVGGAILGAFVGAFAQIALNDHLHPWRNPPSLNLTVGPSGGLSVAAEIRF